MLNFNLDENCYGCSACYAVCPTNAIKMIKNQKGFLIPQINDEICIKCGLCDKKCVYLNKMERNVSLPNSAISTYSISEERLKSASGGLFFSIAKKFLEAGENHYVSGCIWNKNLEAEHIVSNDLNDLRKMRDSKYVQSNLNNCFNKIKSLLNDDKKVLFSGTSCQIAGLYSVVGYHRNLYTCAIFCEGVPSPRVFEKYKDYLRHKYKSEIVDISFRNKEPHGWNQPYIRINLKNGKEILKNPTFDPYTMGFYNFLFLRNTCYKCSFKCDNYNADILIGDHWGCSKEDLELSSNKGLSACFVLTKKGEELLKLDSTIHMNSVPLNKIIKRNHILIESVNMNPKRDKFFESLNDIDFYFNVTNNIEINKFKFYMKKVLDDLKIYPYWKIIKYKVFNK